MMMMMMMMMIMMMMMMMMYSKCEYYAISRMVIYFNDKSMAQHKAAVTALLTHWSSAVSRGWDVIWRYLFVQIELRVDIASLGIK